MFVVFSTTILHHHEVESPVCVCVECVCVSLEFEGAFTHVHTHVDGGQSRILGIFPCHPPLYCPESLTDLEVQGFSEAQRPENSRYQHVSTPSECWVCRCTAMPGCLSRCCGFKFTFSWLHSKHYLAQHFPRPSTTALFMQSGYIGKQAQFWTCFLSWNRR